MSCLWCQIPNIIIIYGMTFNDKHGQGYATIGLFDYLFYLVYLSRSRPSYLDVQASSVKLNTDPCQHVWKKSRCSVRFRCSIGCESPSVHGLVTWLWVALCVNISPRTKPIGWWYHILLFKCTMTFWRIGKWDEEAGSTEFIYESSEHSVEPTSWGRERERVREKLPSQWILSTNLLAKATH